MEDYVRGSEAISLFCRINMNAKRELKIRASEMGLLIYIVKSEEPRSPIKIAEFFKVTKPMVTAMVNSLCKKGYLKKLPSKIDKRSFTLLPTEIAVQLVEETYTEYFKNLALLKSEMGNKKYKDLIDLLEMANTILLEDNKK